MTAELRKMQIILGCGIDDMTVDHVARSLTGLARFYKLTSSPEPRAPKKKQIDKKFNGHYEFRSRDFHVISMALCF
jgi:hypothetical protein